MASQVECTLLEQSSFALPQEPSTALLPMDLGGTLSALLLHSVFFWEETFTASHEYQRGGGGEIKNKHCYSTMLYLLRAIENILIKWNKHCKHLLEHKCFWWTAICNHYSCLSWAKLCGWRREHQAPFLRRLGKRGLFWRRKKQTSQTLSERAYNFCAMEKCLTHIF